LTKEKLSQETTTVDPSALIQWIRKAKKGDIESCQKIYEIFVRRVLSFIHRMVNSPQEAEDLAQETFVAVFQKLGTLKDDTRFEPWLFRIARNFVFQRYRARSYSTISIDALDENGQVAIELVDTRKDPDEAFQHNELKDVVANAIASLPEKYREVFVLSALQQLSYKQIAEVVERSLPSVKTDIHRARLEIRNRVKDYLKV
jgi:RNA polymerase sigma-70 factor, ECF subfamily